MSSITVVDDDENVSTVVLVQLYGEKWTLTAVSIDGRLPVPRRWMAQALRQLADAFDEAAEQVGD